MAESELHIDEAADDSLSVAPPEPETDPARDDAGTDASIEEDLGEDAEDGDAQLDRGLDESMDASDTPSSLQPGSGGDAAPSSGYDEEAERQRDA